MTLTTRQRRFCEHYAACGNATEAAANTGYKKPHPEGARLLRNATVQATITELMKAEDRARIANARDRQQFWTGLMRDNEADMRDRLKASELLGKAQGDFLTKVEVTDKTPPVKTPMTAEQLRKLIREIYGA